MQYLHTVSIYILACTCSLYTKRNNIASARYKDFKLHMCQKVIKKAAYSN